MPGEDEYWERIRERMEMGETEPEPEEKILSLDEELENCASHSRYFSDELDAQFF